VAAITVLIGALATGMVDADAADSAHYFASIKNDKIFMRVGPGEQYDVKWVYHRKGLPVEVLGTYDAWRRVRDMDGETGWIHTALLSRERTAVVTGQEVAPVLSESDANSRVLAEVKPGAVGRLRHCDALTCEVKFDGAEGWVSRTRLWGLHDGEQF
jgi:SH3-like domain-containing protein